MLTCCPRNICCIQAKCCRNKFLCKICARCMFLNSFFFGQLSWFLHKEDTVYHYEEYFLCKSLSQNQFVYDLCDPGFCKQILMVWIFPCYKISISGICSYKFFRQYCCVAIMEKLNLGMITWEVAEGSHQWYMMTLAFLQEMCQITSLISDTAALFLPHVLTASCMYEHTHNLPTTQPWNMVLFIFSCFLHTALYLSSQLYTCL